MVPEQGCIRDEASVALSDDIAPVLFLGRVARGGDDLEIGRADVGANEEAISVIHDLVEETWPARRDQSGRRGRMVEIDDPCLRGVVTMHRDDGCAAEASGFDTDEPGRVVFREHLDVVALRCPEPMHHDPAGPMALVLLDIKKRLRIPGPDDVSGRAGDAIGKVLLSQEIANGDGQDFGAEVVGAPGEFGMVGRMACGREMKKGLSLRPRVTVDQHCLRAALARFAAIDATLAAAAKTRIIGPRSIDLRRLAVVLLEARAHLALEVLLQAARRRQNGVGIGVLGLEQRADVGGQPTRIAQHLAPVVGPYPGVIVGPGQAMGRANCGPDLGARGRGDRGPRACSADRLGSGAGHAVCARATRASARKVAGTWDGDLHKVAAPAARSSSAPP